MLIHNSWLVFFDGTPLAKFLKKFNEYISILDWEYLTGIIKYQCSKIINVHLYTYTLCWNSK
ncbi:hypothetical protein M5D96_005052 [Drosophila gunungcola]|uniref:Uncharacterized protein n=1 Tax=Drosophila gunungcola TaxID=103775 RepID=A0A9Q0BTY8_9MUSC|nr:hypothetical protein M5D96_005052 [Drosophila gunungcola]